MSGSPLSEKSGLPTRGDPAAPTHPLETLSTPLTYPPIEGEALWHLTPERQARLRGARHFLVRGADWIERLEMPVREFANSTHRDGIFGYMRTLGPDWAKFLDGWYRPDQGARDRIGQNIVSSYLASNTLERFLNPTDIRNRYFSLDRALAFLVLCHRVSLDWFSTKKGAKDHRRKFAETYKCDYYPAFVFDFMWIEPIIYKMGRLSEADQEALTGVPWPGADEPSIDIGFKSNLVTDFQRHFSGDVQKIQFDWTKVAPEDVLKAVFLQDRSADLMFMQELADFTARWLKRPNDGRCRHGNNFPGPVKGIVLERYLEISCAPLRMPRRSVLVDGA